MSDSVTDKIPSNQINFNDIVDKKQMSNEELKARAKIFSHNAIAKLSWIDETIEELHKIKKLNNLQ